MNKWISQNKIIALVLYNMICWTPFILLSLTIEMRLITWIAFGIFIFIISLLFVSSTDRYVMNKAVKQMNEQCDPYILLENAEQQLQRVKSKSYEKLLLINKAVALRDLGQFDEVFSILSTINIDQYSTTLPLTKIIYYNNLVDILIIKGDFFQAKIWHAKMMQMINDMKVKEKQKHQLTEISTLNQAELLLADNQLDEAENLINKLSEQITNRQRISKCMLLAKLYIKRNMPDDAKQYLQFVIDYGNRLYDVIQAKGLLDSLSGDIEKSG